MMDLGDPINFIVLATLLPLVPSIMIFLIFPKSEVTAAGPLSQLTVRATGAFAGYLIIFVALVGWGRSWLTLDRYWEIRADMIVRDAAGNVVNPKVIDRRLISVTMDPSATRYIANGAQATRVVMKAAELNGTLPAVTVQYGEYGNFVLDFTQMPEDVEFLKDYKNRVIKVTTPLQIQPVVPPSTGIVPPNTFGKLNS